MEHAWKISNWKTGLPLTTSTETGASPATFSLMCANGLFLFCTVGRGGGGILPLMGTCGQPGYNFWDFCLKQGIDFQLSFFVLIRVSILSIFVLNRVSFSWTINSLRVCSTNYTTAKFLFIIVLHRVWFRVKCLKQGIKNRNSVLNRVGKSVIFVLNRVRV